MCKGHGGSIRYRWWISSGRAHRREPGPVGASGSSGGSRTAPAVGDRDRRHAAECIAAGGASGQNLPRRLAGRRARRAARPKPSACRSSRLARARPRAWPSESPRRHGRVDAWLAFARRGQGTDVRGDRPGRSPEVRPRAAPRRHRPAAVVASAGSGRWTNREAGRDVARKTPPTVIGEPLEHDSRTACGAGGRPAGGQPWSPPRTRGSCPTIPRSETGPTRSPWQRFGSGWRPTPALQAALHPPPARLAAQPHRKLVQQANASPSSPRRVLRRAGLVEAVLDYLRHQSLRRMAGQDGQDPFCAAPSSTRPRKIYHGNVAG